MRASQLGRWSVAKSMQSTHAIEPEAMPNHAILLMFPSTAESRHALQTSNDNDRSQWSVASRLIDMSCSKCRNVHYTSWQLTKCKCRKVHTWQQFQTSQKLTKLSPVSVPKASQILTSENTEWKTIDKFQFLLLLHFRSTTHENSFAAHSTTKGNSALHLDWQSMPVHSQTMTQWLIHRHHP